MKTIYKYPLKVKGPQTISIPEGAEFLSVIEQDDCPVVYFLVDPSRESWPISFILLGTGHPVEKDLSEYFIYLGTVSTFNGQLVWHIFALQSATWKKRF